MIAPMSDRAIPGGDGAPACPFIAFEDDRDARSTAPDHRHRCFAEPVPAPRAIAHQDAYCLSPAFAVCPTFQDWARREAAVAKPAAGSQPASARPHEGETSRPVAPPAPDRGRDPAAAAVPPSRRAARDWAAPPPWLAEAESGHDAPDPSAGPASGRGAPAAPDARAATPDWGSSSRGLADSAAARLAGPDPNLPRAARPVSAVSSRPDADDVGDDDPDGPAADSRVPPPSGDTPSRAQSDLGRGQAPRPGPPPRRGHADPPARVPSGRDGARPKDPQELFGPGWEHPRRNEAYPSLRTRVGLPSLHGVPRIALGAIALVIAAAFLFVVSPMLLGLGKDRTPTGSTAPASQQASTAPSAAPSPTPVPAPTATTYTVVAGDTLTRIATKFGVTVKDILKANPQIKNQNAIKIGDVLTIPAPSGAAPSGGVTGASPSAVSGASAAP